MVLPLALAGDAWALHVTPYLLDHIMGGSLQAFMELGHLIAGAQELVVNLLLVLLELCPALGQLLLLTFCLLCQDCP